MSAWYNARPKAAVITTSRTAMSTACTIRAARNNALGRGVPLIRLRTPASRWNDTDIAMLL